MTGKVITLQQLKDASVDADALERILNDSEWVEVETRLGRKVFSIATINALISKLSNDVSVAINELQDAIEIAAAAGAGANGWTAHLIVDGNLTQHQRNLGIKSIAQLRLTKPSRKGERVFLASVNEDQNEGGGEFIATKKSGLVDDGGLIVSSPDPLIFWVRINYTNVNPEMFGAVGDNIADDAIPLQKTMSCGRAIKLDKDRKYRSSEPIEMFSGQKIKGNGATITKYSASKTGITGRTNPSGTLYDYNQDCAVVFGAWFGWYSDINIENITIIKEQVVGADVGKVFFAPYISMSTLKSVVVKGGEYGFFGEDLWMMNWIRCEAYSKCGFYVGTGTSNQFNTCWSKETKAGYSAFRLHNLTYSALINCCAEHVGDDGAPADAAYHITNSDITMIGCGAENVHAYNLIRIGYSWVTIDNPSFIYGINNKYRHATYTGLIDIDSSDSVVSLKGGRITSINSEVFADAVRVNGGTFNYESPLWVGVGFPDDTSDFKIRVSNWAAILDLSSFTGRKYTYNGRAQTWINKTPTQFNGGIMLNDLGATHLNNIRKHGYFGSQGSGANGSVANGYPVDGFGGVVLNFASGDDGIYTNAVQLALPINSNTPSFRRAGWSENFSNWINFYTSANTTVTADGTLKAASPIVKLFSDHIECNDEAEEQNPLFEKVSTGHYLVKNTLGFAQDGWWIEVPGDSNGNKICAIKYQTLENGDIEVKTFKRKFDIETASIIADEENPIDIPENMNGEQRWIDLRLNEADAE